MFDIGPVMMGMDGADMLGMRDSVVDGVGWDKMFKRLEEDDCAMLWYPKMSMLPYDGM